MIVKTGANYQAEGGYIEASKSGTNITATIDGENYTFKSDADSNVSLYKTQLRLAQELSLSVYCLGLSRYDDTYSPSGLNLTNAAFVEKYAGDKVGVYFDTTNITNPVLAEGSHNTILEKTSSTVGRIFATGQDAVAIIKEAE